MNMKNFLLVAVAMIFILTGCADVSNVQECLPPSEHTYGFWGGVWHGAIMWFSFTGSLFNDNIAVYAVNNNGAWYNFGFIGGLWFIIRLLRFTIKGMQE